MNRSINDPFGQFELDGWDTPEVSAAYHKSFSRVTPHAIEPLLEAVSASSQRTILDVATGPGYAAAFAKSHGMEVVGLDFAEAQLRLARRTHPEVEFVQGDAQELPFNDESFDCVICNMGLMHFPDPDKAILEAFRVLRTGGRYAFSSFDTPDKTFGFGVLYAAIERHGSLDVGLPGGPNYFKFSAPSECVASLKAAGFSDLSVTAVDATWSLHSPDELIEFLEQGTVRAAATLAAQTDLARGAIISEVREAVSARQSQAGMYDVPMPLIIASGQKP